MTRRSLAIVVALLFAPYFQTPAVAQRAQTAAPSPVVAVRQSESQVRSMPLEQRPNRLGHFYGNTIRRRKTGSLFVNRQHSDRPMARYFYMAR